MCNARPVLLITLCLVVGGAASAAESTGAVVVRIPDGSTSRCVNAATDQIWLTMRRVILKKQASLFTEDKYAGVIVGTTVSGNTGTKTEKITFPRMIEADIQSYAAGHGVSIPVEFGLIEGLKLRDGSVAYSNVDFDFTVIKGKKKNGWGQALNALVGITKKLPIPSNLFTEGFRYFAEYANSVVDASMQDRESDKLKQGVVHLSFSPNGQCTSRSFESTGTVAVIFATPGSEAEGVVDIGKINNNEYCWSAELQPAFTVKYGKRVAVGTCLPVTAVRNDYYGFFLNATPVSTNAAAGLREDYVSPVKTAVYVSSDTASKLAWTIGGGDAELRAKAATAASWDPSSTTIPFGDLVARTLENTLVWRATGVESAAFDIAEALRRCTANNVSAEKCLPGANVDVTTPPKP